MKFRISVSPEKREELERFLMEHGIETDPNAEYAIVEESHYPDFLSARDRHRENVRIAIEDVIFIEAFGKEIEIHTLQDTFYAQDRMYQLEELLNPRAFLRISKSVIIAGIVVLVSFLAYNRRLDRIARGEERDTGWC